MSDILVNPLPRFANQFETGKSLYRCAEASEAICADFAYPHKFNLAQVMHDEYQRNAGPDLPGNQNGTSKEQVVSFFEREHIGFIDMPTHDLAALFSEMEAQNAQGYIQFLTVADESFMIEYGTEKKMHNWADQGLHHCIVRLGCNTEEPYGFYYDPAASPFCYDSSTGKSKAVKIARENIEKAGVMTAFCIMKPGVVAPPHDFSFQHSVWPIPPAPKPVLDIAKVLNNLNAIGSVGQQLTNLATELAKDIAVLKEEV